jgi:predicted nucleic acid-binding protein
MIVIADTSPLNYLILIRQTSLLPALYGRVFIPEAVCTEMKQPRTPAAVRDWMAHPPDWLEIRKVNRAVDSDLEDLDSGEQEAITLAQELQASVMILDERDARREARRRHFTVVGTLGVLEEASKRGLLDLPSAITDLQKTTFRADSGLIQSFLDRDAQRRQSRRKP